MKSVKLKKKRIIALAIVVFFMLLYHEKIINVFDKLTMPDSSELCKIALPSIRKKFRLDVTENIDQIERGLSNHSLRVGGKWMPKRLQPNYIEKNKLAIIVPYRDRLTNLEIFLKNIHPFLMRQNIYYKIYLVEPIEKLTFNKGISMNAGFLEAIKEDNYNCFIFHDVDMVPENDANLYGCHTDAPKLMAVAISAFGYSVEGYFKEKYFGGVTAFTRYQFSKINGFSNSYYGWGLEDDDARDRVLSKYKGIIRIPPDVGRYFAHCHAQQTKNPNRFLVLIKARITKQETDGLNTVKYNIVSVEKRLVYTKFYISYKNNE